MPLTLPPLIDALRQRLAEEVSPEAGAARTFFAPGRVNLLGAHQDYVGGFVLPCAIDRGTYVVASAREDARLTLRSLDREPALELDLRSLPGASDARFGWGNYAIGVLRAIREEGIELRGMDLVIGGDLPIGAGLSSSASLSLACALAACGIAEQEMPRRRLAECVRRGENEFVGVRCGILDPYACSLARAGHALFIDCLEGTIEHVPFPTESLSIAVCDTGLRRSLTDGRFNQRVGECSSALERLRQRWPELRALRDVDTRHLELGRDLLDPVLEKRVRHVSEETPRCRRGAAALRSGDLETFGAAIDASHESCRRWYEISCPELDWIADRGRELPFVLGTRLTGAGFGGCTVALLRAGSELEYREAVEAPYAARFQRRATVHFFSAGAGARELDPIAS
ncbi:MAG: galactokinase [Planctomycetes bacterium]|nr:galactokinase [Planctomycetota bacterium]